MSLQTSFALHLRKHFARQSMIEPFHHDHHVFRHCSLRIGRMIASRGWAAATSVAAQIGADDCKVVGK
jgi:hypothetical protein